VEICKWIRNFLTDIARSDRKMLGSLSLAGARRSLTGVRSLLGSHSMYSTCVRDRSRSWRKHVTRNVNVQLQHCLRSAPPLTTDHGPSPNPRPLITFPCFQSDCPVFCYKRPRRTLVFDSYLESLSVVLFSFFFQRCEKSRVYVYNFHD
jgi:hypothetical protein